LDILHTIWDTNQLHIWSEVIENTRDKTQDLAVNHSQRDRKHPFTGSFSQILNVLKQINVKQIITEDIATNWLVLNIPTLKNRPIPSETRITKRINKRESDLVVDGGNVISYRDKFILTEKVFDENSNLERETVIKKLKSALNTDQIYFIPKEPYDIIGHADGFVRFVDENRIIVNNYSHQSISWKKKMDKALKDTGLEVITFPTEVTDEKNEEGVYSAKGIYINFAQIGRKILFPQFGFKTDSIALKEAKKEFPDCDIIPVDSNEIAMDGGVLNCITWNNKFSTKTSLTKGVKKAPTFEEQEEFVYDNIDFYLSSCDYERISNGFEKAWMGNEGEFMGDTDYKKVVYRHLENLIPKNLIPQYYVDKTVDLILEYMESIGQYGVDFGEN